MPLLSIDRANQAINHECPNCGDVHVFAWANLIVDDTITTPLCPACGKTQESFRARFPDHEVGIGSHPGSLLDHQFPDTGGIVTEHLSGYDLHADRIAVRLRHRTLLVALQNAGLAHVVKGP